MQFHKFILILCSVFFLGCEERESTIVVIDRIIDGDTFVANEISIRLWGIDAPEKNEETYLASKLYLEILLSQGEVNCNFHYQDRYERDVMQCFINGDDIGSDMVKFGMAKDYIKYSNGHYQFEEAFAKKKRAGIWKHSIDEEI